jgi:MOSC domain-containing protein YiiM
VAGATTSVHAAAVRGRVEAIYLFPVRRGPAEPLLTAVVRTGRGLVGDRRRGARRQVTVLALEDWAAATGEIGVVVPPERRRANLVVSGVAVGRAPGHRLRIGADVALDVLGETTPCRKMEEVSRGLMRALAPRLRAGVFGAVARGGVITVGDAVWIEERGEER